MPRRFRRGPIALALLVVFIGAACAGSALDNGGANESSAGEGNVVERRAVHQAAPAQGELADQSGDYIGTGGGGSADSGSGNGDTSDTGGPSDIASGPNVIKNGSISLRVGDDEVRNGVQDVVSLASRFGGYVTSSTISSGKNATADVIIRVPAENFEKAVAAVTDIGKVDEQNITGEDVTDQVIDLEARLRNARAQEAVLLRLMDQSQTVTDTIRVQQTLSGVQLDIERLRGQLRHLDDQTAYGTLAVSLFEGAPPVAAGDNIFERAWEVLRNTASAIASSVALGLAFLIPVLLFLALAALVIVPVAKRVRRRLA